MKAWFLGFAALALGAHSFAAPAAAPNQETLDDIAKHEKIAAAHTEAAKCLHSGKPYEEC